jgi:hypothetical protein
MEAHIATLDRQNKDLKAILVKMETAQGYNTKATIAELMRKNNNLNNLTGRWNGLTLITLWVLRNEI